MAKKPKKTILGGTDIDYKEPGGNKGQGAVAN